jgi:hypothetical protein
VSLLSPSTEADACYFPYRLLFCPLVFPAISDSTSFHAMKSISRIFRKDKASKAKLEYTPLENIPRNILAFRTITRLLSYIQQEREFEVFPTPSMDLDEAQRLELKVSNAFSTLAVIQHEVVSVVSSRAEKSLLIVASVYKDSPSAWQLLVTQNNRRDGVQAVIPDSEPGNLTICDVKTLAGIDFDSDDDKAIKEYALGLW